MSVYMCRCCIRVKFARLVSIIVQINGDIIVVVLDYHISLWSEATSLTGESIVTS